MQARALAVADLLVDLSTITDAAFRNCTLALVDTVFQAPEQTCVGTSFGLISNSLSRILGKGADLSEDILRNVTQALTVMTQACQSNTAAGEFAQTISTPNIELSVAVLDNGGNQTIISAAQSPYDALNAIPTSYCGFNTTGLASTESLSVMVYEYKTKPRGRSNSSQIGILETINGNDGTSSRKSRTLMGFFSRYSYHHPGDGAC